MSQLLQSFSYHQPECELSLQAKVSPLSQWLPQTILAELNFSLRVGNSRLKGNQQLLEELIVAVANYVEGYLQSDRVGELVSRHQISYGRWRKLELTTLQLFDLHVVLEEFTGQCQLLPKIRASIRPAWLGMVAVLIAVVGVGTWRVSSGETPVAVRPEVPQPLLDSPPVPPKASKDSFEPTKKTTPAPEKSAQPQPLKPADPISNGTKIQDEAIPLTSPTAPTSGEPSDPAMIPEEPPAISTNPAQVDPVPNQPQARTGSVSAKIKIVGMRKITVIAPNTEEPDYVKAIAQLNAQLEAKLDRQKVTISETIPRELVLILTAVKVANKQKLWLRAEPNQDNAVQQMSALLQEVLNQNSSIVLPAGEYELLLQIAEKHPLGGTK